MSFHERERLSAYLDRELAPAEHAAVESHVAACPECAAFLAELAAVDEAAAALPAEAPEGYFDGFPARVRSRLGPRKAAFPGQRLPAWTWAAAAALLLAVVTPLMLRQVRPPAEAPSFPSALKAAPAAPAPADQARRPEAPSKDRSTRAEPGPPARRAVVAPTPPSSRPEEADADFAREPGLLPPAPAKAVAAPAEVEAAPAAEGGLVAQGARANAEERMSDASQESAGAPAAAARAPAMLGRAAGAADARGPGDAFSRLEARRPRTTVEWRRLRDAWDALAASLRDGPQADEARVRAVVAAREAWLSGGEASDRDAFRRDAAAYLRREDARQKPRVEGLLAEP
jgi:hypothetical protein